MMHEEGFNPSWFIAIGSISSAIIAAVALFFAWKSLALSKDQSRPNVKLYVVPDKVRRRFLQIIVENVGSQTAFDIKFKSDFKLPCRTTTENGERVVEHILDGPLVKGIPALASGDKRVVRWGHYDDLSYSLKTIGRDFITIEFAYSNANAEREYVEHSVIEVQSFADTNVCDDPIVKIADNIDIISQRMTTNGIAVVVKKATDILDN
tara:strand:- start:417 stop:1040 length:624 start_codon:yes stop_codon:yes gene_type:complete